MPPLASNAIGPGQYLAAHHHTATDARAENHTEDDIRSSGRAVGGLG